MALSRQPELAKCSQHSILRALMDAAALGIKPGGLMGRGYLVPRKNKKNGELECCFDPGWRGLIDIARRSGQIKRIEAHVVYEKDIFEVHYGMHSDLIHKPMLDGDAGNIIAAYAVAEFKDGSTQVEVLTKRELDKVRGSSAASSGGPWGSWFEEMARKTAVRRLCKYLPYTDELERAIEAATDAEAEDAIGRDAGAAAQLDAPKRGTALAEKIRARGAANMAPDLDLPPEGVDADGELHDPVTGEVHDREPGID
jgi:recombination protein RecT